jgi:hypothetical protein
LACDLDIRVHPTKDVQVKDSNSLDDFEVVLANRLAPIGEGVAKSTSETWLLSMADGSQSCEIELLSIEGFGPSSVFAAPGCPDGFFNVVGWEIDRNELRFLSPTGRVMATFQGLPSSRMYGTRENDGARLIMTRAAPSPGYLLPSL